MKNKEKEQNNVPDTLTSINGKNKDRNYPYKDVIVVIHITNDRHLDNPHRNQSNSFGGDC